MKILKSVMQTGFFSALFAVASNFVSGQQFNFNNRVAGVVDARVTFLDGTGVGSGFVAQLYGGPDGTPIEKLSPLFPTTTFRTGSLVAMGYVNGVALNVPGVLAGEKATFVMRAFNDSTWETSTCRGESNPITVTASGGSLPPANLFGLKPFQVDCIPELGTLTLVCCGSGFVWLLSLAGRCRRQPER
ncbi:MAG: hypothetical protein L0Z50_22085 [Verrucomicrobiales bacterium]|nr:hypothetical protein [Verrucomicrobiales bacterium]